ncbi:S8 family peptidase, partial [Xylella taiwanensis]
PSTTTPSLPPLEPSIVSEFNAHLDLTNTKAAHALGLTGNGYIIGVVDSGVNRNHIALQGKVIRNNVYVDHSDPSTPDDVGGHGTQVAQLAAGKPVEYWPGGIAPGASIFSARVFSSEAEAKAGQNNSGQVIGSFFEREASHIQRMNTDMSAAGVRIQNNSWGYEDEDTGDEPVWTSRRITGFFVNAYRDFVLGNNGLVVFASGNESQPQPGQAARLPSLPTMEGAPSAADLERGWLVVAALDSFDHPDQLASYSNHCGIAMHYCLAAPGDVVAIDYTMTTSDVYSHKGYEAIQGTSFAA